MILKGLVLLTIFQLQPCSFIMANPVNAFDSKSQRLFSGNLLPFILDKKSSQNEIYSPASIHSSLALTYLGAKGDTAEEIRQVLNLAHADKSAFASQYGNFLKTIVHENTENDDDKPQLKMNTRLYVSNEIKILPEFNKLAENNLGSEAENVDFSQSETVVEKINKWVENKTENKIKNLLATDAVDDQTSSVLVNTIYFKAQWLNPFSASDTTKKPFHNSPTEKVEVDTMYIDEWFRYAELNDINATVLEMPYENSNISMMVILPNKIDGLEELEKNLIGKDLNDISDKLKEKKVEVYLPKFRIESDIDLKDTLEKMGCRSMFGANANLSGMFDSTTPLRISDVKHKAFLDCNEAGSEAAAANFLQLHFLMYNPNKKVFRADHPFVFVIRSNEAVYFTGHVAKF